MRLGEFRTKTRDCKNKLKINLSVYDDIKHNADGYIELDIDMVTDNDIYLRPLDEIVEQSIKKQCNHKKAILDFLKFMNMNNPLMEIMVDEFLEEVYDGD